MVTARRIVAIALLGALAACSREQQDWRSAEGRDTPDAYGQFIERHPDSELVKEARARIAQLAEDRDWADAAKADTAAAYQLFLTQHPAGKWAQEARIRVQNFSLAAAGGELAGAGSAATGPAAGSAPATGPAAGNAPAAGPAAGNAPAAVSGPPTAPPASAAPATTGQNVYGIQLGAFTSEDRANAEWRALQTRFAPQLQGLAPQVVAAETASGRVFRLQALGGDEARARQICEQLRERSQECVPVIPH